MCFYPARLTYGNWSNHGNLILQDDGSSATNSQVGSIMSDNVLVYISNMPFMFDTEWCLALSLSLACASYGFRYLLMN